MAESLVVARMQVKVGGVGGSGRGLEASGEAVQASGGIRNPAWR